MTGFWVVLAGAGLLFWWKTANSPRIPNLPFPQAELLLVPITPEGEPWDLVPLAQCLAPRLGWVPHVDATPLALPHAALGHRGKYDAVALARMMSRRSSENLAVIGLVPENLYSSARRDLPFAMGAREHNGAVISARFLEGERLEKMILRYIGEMVFKLPRSDEPTSLLYRDLTQPEQLDDMDWRYI